MHWIGDMLYGMFISNWAWAPYNLLVALVIGIAGLIVGTSFYYHRVLTHGGITIRNQRLELCCRIVGWVFTAMDRWKWVYVHRKHHLHTDEPDDPYSPNVSGFWTILLWNGPVFSREKKKPDIVDGTYAESWDPPHDRLDKVFGKAWLGIIVLWLFYFCLFTIFYRNLSAVGTTSYIVLAHFAVILAGGGMVNALNHCRRWLRKKRLWMTIHDAKSGLTYNRPWLALLIGGEGWHNNHHRFPRNYRFGPNRDAGARLAEWFAKRGWVELQPMEREMDDIMAELHVQKDKQKDKDVQLAA